MDLKNQPFDSKLDLWKTRIPSDVRDAAVFVSDTMELSWASARQTFGDQATPEQAFQIYDRLVRRMDEVVI